MKKIRLGAVHFLNAKPLISPLLQGEVTHNFDIRLTTPAQLADWLYEGIIDVGLIPAIEYARLPENLVVPGLALSAKGGVRSVLLYARKDISDIETVALDTASRTSAALVRILLEKAFHLKPRYIPYSPQSNGFLKLADAALVIGDNALRFTPDQEHYLFDLSEEWLKFSGLPFVFAFFAMSPQLDPQQVLTPLKAAKQKGLTQLTQIARHEATKLGISYLTCLDYLKRRMTYDFSEEQLQGLTEFFRLAQELGLIEREVKIKFA